MPPNPLTKCEIQKCYKNEPECNGVYSKINLYKIKNGAYMINLNEYESIGTHWIATLMASDVKHIPREIMQFTGNKNVVTNIYRVQPDDSMMCRYFCIGFIDFMLKGKTLLECTDLFSPNDYEKNDKIILKYFQ